MKYFASLFTLLILSGCVALGVDMSEQLKNHGVSAEATIVDVWDTGWTINDDPVIGMHVDVRPANAAVFRATIAKTAISRVDVPQFQPGKVIPVRYDPTDPKQIAVDRGTGNPYHDGFESLLIEGSQLAPPQPPLAYRGGADADADFASMMQNGYLPIGVSVVARGGDNPADALAQAKEEGASVVVLYGDTKSDLTAFPFAPATASSELTHLPQVPPGGRMATYFGKNRPSIFGLVGRELTRGERSILKRDDGIVAELVPIGSPVANSGITQGDVIVAVDGRPVHHGADLSPDYIKSIAGKSVVVDYLRGGVPASTTVKLNPVPAP